jgi:hypothetical protein
VKIEGGVKLSILYGTGWDRERMTDFALFLN